MYPTIITPSSPSATMAIENQNGSPISDNSKPTIRPLKTTGKIMAMIRYLLNMIPMHATKVAAVPKARSIKPSGETKLAMRQSSVKPIAFFYQRSR